MRHRLVLNGSRKNGFDATVSARALKVASFSSLSGRSHHRARLGEQCKNLIKWRSSGAGCARHRLGGLRAAAAAAQSDRGLGRLGDALQQEGPSVISAGYGIAARSRLRFHAPA